MSNNFIPLSEPLLIGKEKEYVLDCLDSGWVSTAGSFVDRFEEATREYMVASNTVAVASGTAALHLALAALGLGSDHEILVNSLTFIAPVNAIRYVGANPVFMDVDSFYWQMDVEKVMHFIDKECIFINGQLINRLSRRQVKAILLVHLFGNAGPVKELRDICDKYNLYLVEDFAQGFGAKYDGRFIGTWGDVSCTSFNGNKTITAGAGGMVLCQDEEVAGKVRYLSTQAKEEGSEYLHNDVGYNYRMSNIHAAIGLAQLEQVEKFISKRRETSQAYQFGLSSIPNLSFLQEKKCTRGGFWLATVRFEGYTEKLENLLTYLDELNIQARKLWQPIHLSKPYLNCQAYLIEVSEALYGECLSLPSSVSLSKESQIFIIESLKSKLK